MVSDNVFMEVAITASVTYTPKGNTTHVLVTEKKHANTRVADWVKQLSRGTTVNATVVLIRVATVAGRVGTISFTQEGNGTTTVEGNISGVAPGDHALVIHTYGNINNAWITTGAPFKPAGTKGVIDNITVDVDGTATFKIYGKIPLSGPDSVTGSGLVLHSNPSPNPGPGVAWGKCHRSR